MQDVSGESLQDTVLSGADALKTTLKVLDRRGASVFDLGEAYRVEKLAVLLADKYRQEITYPMDKQATDGTAFSRALYADRAVHYARPDNALQPDMGLFTDAQVELHSAVTDSKTVSGTPGKFSSWTSTGIYAPPGKAITITRTDNSANEIRVRFNMLRHSTRVWNESGYNRPLYLASNEVTIAPGQSYTLSTPYGGPVYVWSRGVNDAPDAYSVNFENVLPNPLLENFDSASIQVFSDELLSTASDWVDIRTPFAEIHSLKSHMISALNKQDGNKDNGYTSEDVQTYISDLNDYLITGNYEYAGISDAALAPLDNDVQQFCTDFGLTAVAYQGSVRNLCDDTAIHEKPKVQHINADIRAACGSLCAGNPFDSGSPIMPLGWGENHEMGHNLQRSRLKIYGSRSSEVSNNLFPLHTSWRWASDQGLSEHPSLSRPNHESAFNLLQQEILAGTQPGIGHPLWSESTIYAKAFERLSFYMQLAYTQRNWNVYTKIYIMERIFSSALHSDADWAVVRDLLKLGSYSRADAKNNERQ